MRAVVIVDQDEVQKILENAVSEEYISRVTEMELQVSFRGGWVPVGSNDHVAAIRFATKGYTGP